MMRSRDRRMEYRGLWVTIRWVELERQGDVWGPGGHRFTGSYLVAGLGDGFASWHHVQDVFVAYESAAAHAFAEAKRAIDARLGHAQSPQDQHEACRQAT